ncbi:hypothetical protein ACFE04_017419 [Oxalis oulophora]
MSFFRSINLLVTFSFLLQTVIGVDPLYHICSNTGNFSASGPYANNLAKLLPSLEMTTPSSGFATATSGQNPEKSYGLALCRGDVSKSDCKTCVTDAAAEITKRCEYNKGAIIWYDNCELRYSNEEFFGGVDFANTVYMWNVNLVSDPDTFNNKTKKLLSNLAEQAVGSSKFFATGQKKLDGSRTLYGLTQCTRDVTSESCKKCLDQIIGELPNCCDAKEGGRVITATCNFRYEIYPFVNE